MNDDYLPPSYIDFDDEEDERNQWLDRVAGRSGGRNLELAKLPYHEYLKTYHWAQMRKLTLSRNGGYCNRCYQESDRLQVHHLTYDRLGNERETDLTVLCQPCHKVIHTVGESATGRDRLFNVISQKKAIA